jgi:hypothetical protein
MTRIASVCHPFRNRLRGRREAASDTNDPARKNGKVLGRKWQISVPFHRVGNDRADRHKKRGNMDLQRDRPLFALPYVYLRILVPQLSPLVFSRSQPFTGTNVNHPGPGAAFPAFTQDRREGPVLAQPGTLLRRRRRSNAPESCATNEVGRHNSWSRVPARGAAASTGASCDGSISRRPSPWRNRLWPQEAPLNVGTAGCPRG